MIEVALTLTREVPSLAPNVTNVVPFKLVPVIVTVVPPAIGPLTGEILVIVGVAT